MNREQLKRYRQQYNISLAELSKYTDITKNELSRYENGHVNITPMREQQILNGIYRMIQDITRGDFIPYLAMDREQRSKFYSKLKQKPEVVERREKKKLETIEKNKQKKIDAKLQKAKEKHKKEVRDARNERRRKRYAEQKEKERLEKEKLELEKEKN